MYCPDNVIEAGYKFLDSVHTNNKCTDEEKEGSLGAFILAIRKDLMEKKSTKKLIL